MKQLTIALFALLVVYPVFACDTPHGNAVATAQTVTDCQYLDAAMGLNEQSALGIFAWSSIGFGLSGGAVTAAPVTLNGGFTRIQTTVDQVIASPAVATDGTDFLLVEYSAGGTATRLMHADGSSGPLTPIVTVTNANISGAPQNSNGGSAAVVWDGNEYLVLTTEFIRPAPDVVAVPKVVSATVRRDGTLASSGVIANNAMLLTAVKSGSSAVAIWRSNGALQAGFALPQQLVTSPIVLPPSDAAFAAAANNGSSIVVVYATGNGLDMMVTDTSFNNRIMKNVNGIQTNGLKVVPDGSDFLVLQSDAGLNTRATRISGGNPGATFSLASGGVVSAASNTRGTVVLSTHGCGTIESQFIARGATTASAPIDLTLKGAAQTDERIIATSAGHQLTYIESHNLFTQFLDNLANAQARTQLTSYAGSFATTQLNGGAAVAWIDGASAQSLKVARFDASGNKRGSTIDVPVTLTLFTVSVAASGDTLLVAYQGTPIGSHHLEVHGALIDTTGNVTQDVVLSGSSDDGSNLTAGVDGGNWMIAWRNGPPHVLVSIETPIITLQAPTRRSIPINPIGLPALVLADSGSLYWIERAAQNFVHKTLVSSGADSVIGQDSDSIATVRLLGGIPVWTVVRDSDTELNSPIGTAGCFASGASVEYDTRSNALAMWVYSDATQLHAETPSAAQGSSRHRAVKH